MKNYRSSNLPLVLLILLTASLGCIGPSSEETRCRATVKSKNERYAGTSKTEEQAKLNACNKFCAEEDPTFLSLYRNWTESGAEREFEKQWKRRPTQEDAIIYDKKLLDYVTKTCSPKCVADANQGAHTLESSCR